MLLIQVEQRNFLFKFQFGRHVNDVQNYTAYNCTLDKYISPNNWEIIFNELKKRVNEYMMDTQRPLATEQIELHQMLLMLNIQFERITKSLISETGLQDEEVHPYFMCIHVTQISDVERYIAAVDEPKGISYLNALSLVASDYHLSTPLDEESNLDSSFNKYSDNGYGASVSTISPAKMPLICADIHMRGKEISQMCETQTTDVDPDGEKGDDQATNESEEADDDYWSDSESDEERMQFTWNIRSFSAHRQRGRWRSWVPENQLKDNCSAIEDYTTSESIETIHDYNHKHKRTMDTLNEIQANLDRINRPVTVDRMM